MIHSPDRRQFLIHGMAAASAGIAVQHLTAPAMAAPANAGDRRPIAIDDPRLPDELTLDYTPLHNEIIDYDFYSLDGMPRLRFRGPLFDPRKAEKGSFFTSLGSAHTLGVLSPTTYTRILAGKLGMPGWNTGVGGISAAFYNAHPAIIDMANRGSFAIVQVTAARLASNDRIQTTPAAQTVFDSRHGDMVEPEMAWARIEREEPEKLDTYIAQSRASWARDHEQLLRSLTVPTVLLWFAVRPIEAGGASIRQVGSTAATAFPQYIDETDVQKIRDRADAMTVCVTSRGSGHPLISRFTGRHVTITYPTVNLVEDANHYYPSPEMHEDAANALLPVVRKWSAGKG
ncbi:DUF6473 family protein [Sphingobium sp. AN641]|uniref:DUF6473 family protein n=1 Tax=Sphingobium sp. AN641 TaxID=3133443 RepID=UPI0030C4F03A